MNTTLRTTLRTTLLAFGLSQFGAAQASEASEFPLPRHSTLTRAEVQAEAHRALAAGEIEVNDAWGRVSAPSTFVAERETVRQEAIRSMRERNHGDRSIATLYTIGSM